MQKSSKSIMADICKIYLDVAEEKKFEFYRLFSSVPEKLYSKYQGKLSKNEIEVRYAAKQLKVKEATALIFYGNYRTGFYRNDVTIDSNNSSEVIRDLKRSEVFRNILWKRHKLNVTDLESLLDHENEEFRTKFDERIDRQQQEPEKNQQDLEYEHHTESKTNVKERIRELKILMHRSHPDKGGTVSLFVRYSKELAAIRGCEAV